MPESLPTSQIADEVFASIRDSEPGADPLLCFAPGRVNLLGAHLDYNGGDVLPVAVDQGVYVAARLRQDGRIRARSLNQAAVIDLPANEISSISAEDLGWAAYPLGVWLTCSALSEDQQGVDLVFGGDLPMAAGLSSSAALELATALALDQLHGFGLSAVELASWAHRAETEFVGLNCGIMDQFASALGKNDHALLLHCRNASYEHVPLPADQVELLVMDSCKPRTLAETCFNERVRECELALEVLRSECGHKQFLCEYSSQAVDAADTALGPVLRKRARHVVNEMARVTAGVESLRDGDLISLGSAIDASHNSTVVDYEVSCEELDVLTNLASSLPSVFGARLTGAGFGGCAIALIEPGSADEVKSFVGEGYKRRFALEAKFYVLKSGPGLRRVR